MTAANVRRYVLDLFAVLVAGLAVIVLSAGAGWHLLANMMMTVSVGWLVWDRVLRQERMRLPTRPISRELGHDAGERTMRPRGHAVTGRAAANAKPVG